MAKPSKKKASVSVPKTVGTKPTKKTPAIKAAVLKTSQGAAHAPKSHTKQGILINLLQCTKGATVAEMIEATGWQKHSVLGTISGVLRKRLGMQVTSSREQRGRVYRIA